MNVDQAATMREEFERFSPGTPDTIRVVFAPGRVNLIGEHTDYNGGYVLPGAIWEGTWCWIRPRADRQWRVASATEPRIVTITSETLTYDPTRGFANYVAGVIWALTAQGIDVPGADCYLAGTLPQGAGLSSSASLEVAAARAFSRIAGIELSETDLASVAHRAETMFVGVPCGIMDQYAVALGRPGHVLSLSAATLDYRLVAADWPDMALIITNSNKPHHLVDSPYAVRRAECAAILDRLQDAGWDLPYLAALTPDDYPQAVGAITDPLLQRRLHHVVWENERARRAPALFEKADWRRFGEWMRKSHESLRDDYEVTGAELDTLAETAWSISGCIGSRMTGAGFGGSTISLVALDAVNEFQRRITETYWNRFGYAPSFIVTGLGPGVHEVPRGEWDR